MPNICPKCQILPTICDTAGDVIISCQVSELTRIVSAILKNMKINHEFEDEHTLWACVFSFEIFLKDLIQNPTLDKTQMEGISLLFIENGLKLTPSMLRNAKTLQKYKDILSSKELANLIDKGALTTHFQPIVDIATSSIYGYESLARGVNDDGTLVYPGQLFKWAKDGDMLFYLDRACRESALKTAAVKNISSKVFINFIPTAIYDPNFCLSSTVKWANQLEFNPKNIVFEVVESEHVEDLEHLKRILDFYKSNGFVTALDDVGSGYSSLNMIAKLMPDIIKVDREIIDKIDQNRVNQSIFKAIVSIAKENGIIVLAEGLERKEELAFVSANGADLVQGYYFGKPTGEPIRKI